MVKVVTTYTNAPEWVVPAGRPPTIREMAIGSVIMRWATIGAKRGMVAPLPCHPDQAVDLLYVPNTEVVGDQIAVCRSCHTRYSATPIPEPDETGRARTRFRVEGRVCLSRVAKRRA